MKLVGGFALAVVLTVATFGALVFIDASVPVNLPYAVVTAAAGLLFLTSMVVLAAPRPVRTSAGPAAERASQTSAPTSEAFDAVRPVEDVVIWLVVPAATREERAA
jgi:hypothetical protein